MERIDANPTQAGGKRTVSHATIARASLKDNVAAGYALQIAYYVIPLLTVPYLVLSLGTEAYGQLIYAQVIMMFAVLLVDAGIDTVSSKELTNKALSDPKIVLRFLATVLLKTASALFVLIIIGIYDQLGGQSTQLLLLNFLMVLGSIAFPAWLFQGLEVIRYTLFCGVLGRLISALLIVILVQSSDDLHLAAGLQAGATLCSGLLALYVLHRRFSIRWRIPFGQVWKEALITVKQTRSLFAGEFVERACAISPVFILGLFAPVAAVGVYGAIEKFIRAAHSLVQPLQRALFPQLCRSWRSEPTAAMNSLKQRLKMLLLVTLVGCIGCYFGAEFILTTIYGNAWATHAWILQGLGLWLIFAVLSTFAGINGLVAANRQQTYTRVILITATVQLSMASLGAALAQTEGMIIALIFSELVRFYLFIHLLKR